MQNAKPNEGRPVSAKEALTKKQNKKGQVCDVPALALQNIRKSR